MYIIVHSGLALVSRPGQTFRGGRELARETSLAYGIDS